MYFNSYHTEGKCFGQVDQSDNYVLKIVTHPVFEQLGAGMLSRHFVYKYSLLPVSLESAPLTFEAVINIVQWTSLSNLFRSLSSIDLLSADDLAAKPRTQS